MQKVSFQLNAADCKKLFKPLFMTINSSAVLPILEDIRVCNNGSLEFSATDLETITKVSFERSIPTNFDICIDGQTIKKMIDNAIENIISFNGDEYGIKMKSGGFTAKVAPDFSEQYPKEVELGETKSFTIDVKDFMPLVKTALSFVSNDDLRPSMTGVCIHDRNGKLFIAATDAHRMYWKEITKTPETMKGCKMIIPAKALRIAVEMFKKGSIKISEGEHRVSFSCEESEINTRKIDSRYPDYEVVIPRDMPISFYLMRKQLVAFLKISAHFTNRSTNQTEMIVSQTSIKAHGEEMDFGLEFNYDLPVYNAKPKFEPFHFAMNLKFLLQLVSQTNDEYVKIEHTGNALKAFIIDDSMLLMPLMTNK